MANKGFQNLKPYFDGANYAHWKFRMETYLDSEGIEVWDSVRKEWTPPIRRGADGEEEILSRDDWTEPQRSANFKNKKVMTILSSSLSIEECGRIQHCSTAYSMWKTLENYHEGTKQVKSKKIQLLTSEYELFKMKSNESITDMTNRLLSIINGMRKLGKHLSLEDVNNKILRSLPLKDYGSRVAGIEEANEDMSIMNTDVLIGKLLTHEMAVKRDRELEAEPEKRKPLALKASTSKSQEESEDDEEMSDDENEDIVMLSRRLKRIIEKKMSNSRKFR